SETTHRVWCHRGRRQSTSGSVTRRGYPRRHLPCYPACYPPCYPPCYLTCYLTCHPPSFRPTQETACSSADCSRCSTRVRRVDTRRRPSCSRSRPSPTFVRLPDALPRRRYHTRIPAQHVATSP